MSISAEVIVLFQKPMAANSPMAAASGLSMIEDADLHCWVSPAGELEYLPETRLVPLLGEQSLDGRLWHGTLGRFWSPSNQNYGGDPYRYAKVIAELAAQENIQFVWYGVLTGDGGCSGVPAVTREWIAAYFGATSPA